MVVITGRNRSRRSYEQSEPTESRPATRRPGQAGATAGRRRPAEARPAAAGARKGRPARWSGRTEPGQPRVKPLNDLRYFGPSFGRVFLLSKCLRPLDDDLCLIEHAGQRGE